MALSIRAGSGICPAPFLEEELYSNSTGFLSGRMCQSLGNVHCCLPCPQTDWLYPDNFNTITDAASWINVAGIACTTFLLLSWAALPVEKTHRHYLSICLAIGVTFMQLGFIIPLAAKPDQCVNAITPNDMYSNRTCAISGAFILAGGWCGVMWVFLRSLSLHLQICWQLVMGKSFMFGAFAAGWGIPAIGLAIALVFSGVSFRFGDTCHINHKNSLADFWIPLLVFAGLTVIIQFATFGYCIKVYLASLADDSNTTQSSGLPSYTNSLRTVSPRQAYRRVRRVLELQWRGIAIVILIIVDVVFFAVVFVYLDNNEAAVLSDETRAEPWLLCLVENNGDKNKCLDLASSIVVNEATVMAVLILLSCNGIWLLLLMGRFSMFTGWYQLVMDKLRPNREFVSVDAARVPNPRDLRTYEMLSSSGKNPPPMKTPDVLLTDVSPAARSGRGTPDYFGREAKYQNPTHSFSSPKPPQGRQWSPSATYAPRMDPLNMNKI